MERHVIESDVLKEELHTARLESGLQVLTVPKPGFGEKYAVFATRYGSVDRRFVPVGGREMTDVPDGIAHFLEHKMFEKEDGDVFEKFADLGASANAFTSYDMTAYLFSCTDAFEANLDVLLNFVQEPHFTEEGVEKEQGIIGQELRMYDDDPCHRLVLNLLQAMYANNPVRMDIGGTVDSIAKIDKDLLYLCYRTFYHPSNMAVAVVGDVDPGAVLEQIRSNVDARTHEDRAPVRRALPDEPPGVARARVGQNLSVSRPLYAIGFKDPDTGLTGEALIRREVATNLMWEVALGGSSTLYNELYEAGLIDDDFSAGYSTSDRFAHSIVGGETEDPERLNEALRVGLERLRREGIRSDDVERVLRTEKGNFLSGFNSPRFVAHALVDTHFDGALLFDYLDILGAVTVDDVRARLEEHVDFARSSVSLVEPIERVGV